MENEEQPKVPKFGVRHGQVVLQMLFYIITFGIQSSLTVTLMNLIFPGNPEIHPAKGLGEFIDIFRMYLIGFLITVLFSGFLSKKCGFKWPMVILMVIISIFTINLPLITRVYGSTGLMVCRFIQGLCAGLGFAMPSDFISKWIPVQERTVLGTAVYASGRFGDVFGILLPYFLGDILGTQFVYTQFGLIAIVWAVLMAIFGQDDPEDYSKNMTISELNYIIDNRGSIRPKAETVTPWKQMFKSCSFWAIVVAQIGASWMMCVLATNIPDYMGYNFKLHQILIAPAVISLISWILSFAMSGITQHLINKEKLTVGHARKILNSIGTFIPAFFFVLFIFIRGNRYGGYILLTLLSVSSIGTICGSRLNINDISPNFAPIIFGISEWIGQIFNVITIEILTEKLFDNWTFLYLFTAILLLITNCFYIKFGSGEEQQWDTYTTILDEESDLSKSSNYVSCDENKYLLFVKK